MATTLLLGSSGQLGSAFLERLDDVVAPSRAEVDLVTLTADDAAMLLEGTNPTVIINCAAWTAVDEAESSEAEATAVNGTSVGRLAEAADQSKIPFVTFSSDYVFDGCSDRPYRESDTPRPINAYGRSKLVGEGAALKHPQSIVIRTSWVQSATHPCFVRKMLELSQDRGELRVVSDQVGSPTFADDLAAATLEVLQIGMKGLVHIVNEGGASWFELASETLRMAGRETTVVPVSSIEYPTPASRPRYSILDTSRLKRADVSPLPMWRTALRETVETIISGHPS